MVDGLRERLTKESERLGSSHLCVMRVAEHNEARRPPPGMCFCYRLPDVNFPPGRSALPRGPLSPSVVSSPAHTCHRACCRGRRGCCGPNGQYYHGVKLWHLLLPLH